MASGKASHSPNVAEFWNVFIEEIPRVPTVDELICRVVVMNYPEGIVRDRKGAAISPPTDASTATKRILFTLNRAIEQERNFWMENLRRNAIFTPQAWGIRLSANISITEAETQILDALEYVGNIDNLDKLFWEAVHRTESLFPILESSEYDNKHRKINYGIQRYMALKTHTRGSNINKSIFTLADPGGLRAYFSSTILLSSHAYEIEGVTKVCYEDASPRDLLMIFDWYHVSPENPFISKLQCLPSKPTSIRKKRGYFG
ncbi:hypothetical protein GGR58DRAFT_527989 [Xylaria digitata]|nr:hypothetical protein GGR58DRAFT_527989 [Xylaria digitata]